MVAKKLKRMSINARNDQAIYNAYLVHNQDLIVNVHD